MPEPNILRVRTGRDLSVLLKYYVIDCINRKSLIINFISKQYLDAPLRFYMAIELENINPKFIELFRQTFGFTEEEFNLFLSRFKVKTINKKDYFLREGECCHSKAYLNKGCTRNYAMDDQGHERILFFAFEDWWLGDMESYYSGKPATTNIQMLEDSEVFVISKENFLKSEQEIPKLKQWYTNKLLRSATASMNRIVEMKTLSAEERYLNLVEKQPHIFQRIPLQYIASYLNIEPQSLSRMRSRLSGRREG